MWSFLVFPLFATFCDLRQHSPMCKLWYNKFSTKSFRAQACAEPKTKKLSVISAKKHSHIFAIHVGNIVTALKDRMRFFLIMLLSQKVPKQLFLLQNGAILKWFYIEWTACADSWIALKDIWLLGYDIIKKLKLKCIFIK